MGNEGLKPNSSAADRPDRDPIAAALGAFDAKMLTDELRDAPTGGETPAPNLVPEQAEFEAAQAEVRTVLAQSDLDIAQGKTKEDA